MIKAIIFDCWNTLFYDSVNPHPFVECSKLIGKDMADYNYLKILEKSFMLEKFDDTEKSINNFLNALDMKISPEKYKLLVEFINKLKGAKKAYPEVLPILEDLRKKYSLGLLSNAYNIGFEKLNKTFNLNQYFKVILTSYETKLLKPNSKLFQLMLQKLNVTKDEVIMVGDSLHDDVLAAENFGIKGILIDRNNSYPDYINRIDSLTEIYKFLE